VSSVTNSATGEARCPSVADRSEDGVADEEPDGPEPDPPMRVGDVVLAEH